MTGTFSGLLGPAETLPKAVAIVSGGLDSTTLLHGLVNGGVDVTQALSFNYGQRHSKELEYARKSCELLHVPWSLIDLWSSGLPDLLSSSESTLLAGSNTDVPEGHYAEENMKATVVPNRNMIMLSIAAGVAVTKGANMIAIGVHAGDHFVYPDCRPKFLRAVADAIEIGNEGFSNFILGFPIYAPFMNLNKATIAMAAITYGVNFSDTWSCYKGGQNHCGRCGTCVERLEAIDAATHLWNERNPHMIVRDDTVYDDTEYWKEAVKNNASV